MKAKPPAGAFPFIDLTAHHKPLRKAMLKKFGEILDSSQFILGPEVEAFERELAAYCGSTIGIGVSNGYDAIRLALEAYGIGPGDEVILPTFTFAATAFAVTHAGATPKLIDIEPSTYSIDVKALAQAIGPRTKAVIPVHLFGHPADMAGVMTIAKQSGIKVLEDAAQAHGARLGKRRVGSIGDIGCFSFYPSKNLGALGDGGALVTNDSALATVIRKLRNCGQADRYTHEFVGYNNRLDSIQAAMLRLKLKRLDASNRRRQAIAKLYGKLLRGVGTPAVRAGAEHVYHLYVIRHPKREEIRQALTRSGIPCGVYYPVPLHLQPCYRSMGHKEGDFPVAEAAAREVLALPIYPELKPAQVRRVANAVNQALH